MGIILVVGHNYNKLTTVFHSPAEQGWVHEQFRDFYKDVKETGYLPHTLLAQITAANHTNYTLTVSQSTIRG